MPKLKIKHEDGKYVIVDEAEYWYGKYTSKEEAQQALEGWKEYYERPFDNPS